MEQFLQQAMETHGDTVYRLALCRLQNATDAEDVYQEVFLKLLRKNPSGWDSEHLKAWLIRVTLNCCADVGRFRLRQPVLSLEELPEIIRQDSDAAELWETIAQLSPAFRTVIHLHYAEGYSTAEIATMLSIPAVTVRTRLFRARKQLKHLLGGMEDEESLPKTDG